MYCSTCFHDPWNVCTVDPPSFPSFPSFGLAGAELMVLGALGGGATSHTSSNATNHAAPADWHQMDVRDQIIAQQQQVRVSLAARGHFSAETSGAVQDPENGADSDGETLEDWFLRRTREYNTRTRERPTDETTWWAFLDFQDEAHRMQRNKNIGPLVERKLAIIERALTFLPKAERLICLRLNLISQHSAPAVAVQAWQAALQQHPQSTRLWKVFIVKLRENERERERERDGERKK
jgi:hypothetical protein